jgi:hypothetical protein
MVSFPTVKQLIFPLLALVLAVPVARGQSGPSLPVYQVMQSGASPGQVTALASSLGIPMASIVNSNGDVSFYDPTNFQAVPTLPVTDPAVISALLPESPNKIPGVPIKFEQLNFNILSNLTVMSSNAAVRSFGDALASVGLTPQSAVPMVTHTLLMAFYTNDSGLVLSTSNYLDTKVSYQFTAGGYPLIGPGAQVQVDYAPNGGVTRLVYAARQLMAGPPVNIISSTEASNRAAALFPGFNGQFGVQLVYYAPPIALGTVVSVIPFYLCTGSSSVTNPLTGQSSTLNLLRQLIPATDDPAYVPALSFSAGGSTQVVANATVSGGLAPYTYEWSGTDPDISNNNGPQITNTPVAQLAPPLLAARRSAASLLTVSWVDTSGLFQLQYTCNLVNQAWSPLMGAVTTSNGVSTTSLNVGQTAFVRAVLPNQLVPITENVELNIIDANGIFVRRSQTLAMLAIPKIILPPINPLLLIGWGTESPYDQDIGGPDTTSWLKIMRSKPIFGQERFYRGAFVADNTDFIDPPNGNNDAIVDSADLTFYVGHGNSTLFTFTTLAGGPATPSIFLIDSEANHSWGNRIQEWLCLLSCDVLDNGQFFSGPNFRWGPDFDGLHLMLGYSTEAEAGCTTGPFGWGSTFEEVFVNDMSASNSKWPLTIQQSWFGASKSTGVGSPAVLAPIGPGGVCDLNDYWWGVGTVGPRIRASQIRGWYYSTESN